MAVKTYPLPATYGFGLKPKTKSMFPWASLISGAASLIGGASSARALREQNKAAAAQAQKQMDFQERMSSTAHQREVTDLRAAGLNPILSGTGGSGASSPGGAMAPVVDEITPAINTAVSIRRANAEVQQIRANTKLTGAQTNSAKQARQQSIAQEQLINEQQRVLTITRPLTSGVHGIVDRLSPQNIDYRNLGTMLMRQGGDVLSSSAQSIRRLASDLPKHLHRQLLDFYKKSRRTK